MINDRKLEAIKAVKQGDKLFKTAFTLAEVLITLGIIGVVATMTMPVIIKEYKKFMIKNQFKKVYSVIQNAFAVSIQEYDENMRCAYTDSETEFEDCDTFFINYFFNNMQIQKFCDGNAYTNGCVPDYKLDNFPDSSSCGFFSATKIKNASRVVILKDNSILFTYGPTYGRYFPLIGFDVNGFKGPNKGGIDVYALSIHRQDNRLKLGNKDSISACIPFASDAYYRKLDEILK